ncbi:hypothetical protein B296_00046492 [Ensete ventricosum]|uniref:Uncharacterized protein n=1 Tax=Ensete ventricosum TaxID=4639 RepID=A0A426WXF9_ENSVE|nr:hypothetical protein B296_00046492 [Ensete ventricosum]
MLPSPNRGNQMLCLLHRVQWIHTTGFGSLAQETLHAGNPRSSGVGAPVGTLMRVFLPWLGCSCKTRPHGWWVPKEVPPTIKLRLIGRVKSDVLLEHRSFFSFLGSGGGKVSIPLRRPWGDLSYLYLADQSSLGFIIPLAFSASPFHVVGNADDYTCCRLCVVSALLSCGSVKFLWDMIVTAWYPILSDL